MTRLIIDHNLDNPEQCRWRDTQTGEVGPWTDHETALGVCTAQHEADKRMAAAAESMPASTAAEDAGWLDEVIAADVRPTNEAGVRLTCKSSELLAALREVKDDEAAVQLAGERLTSPEQVHDYLELALGERRVAMRRRAEAEARLSQLNRESAEARSTLEEARRELKDIDDRLIRPIALAHGEGPTHAVRGWTGRCSLVKNPKSVVLEDGCEDYLPRELGHASWTPSKTLIREALEAGKDVSGASLVQATRVEVRG